MSTAPPELAEDTVPETSINLAKAVATLQEVIEYGQYHDLHFGNLLKESRGTDDDEDWQTPQYFFKGWLKGRRAKLENLQMIIRLAPYDDVGYRVWLHEEKVLISMRRLYPRQPSIANRDGLDDFFLREGDVWPYREWRRLVNAVKNHEKTHGDRKRNEMLADIVQKRAKAFAESYGGRTNCCCCCCM